jgi:hypothetical protein
LQILAHEPSQHLGVTGDDGEQVVEVVGDAGRKSPDAVDLLRMPQLPFAPLQSFSDSLLLGDVDDLEHRDPEGPHRHGDVGRLVMDARHREQSPAHRPIRSHQALLDPVERPQADRVLGEDLLLGDQVVGMSDPLRHRVGIGGEDLGHRHPEDVGERLVRPEIAVLE